MSAPASTQFAPGSHVHFVGVSGAGMCGLAEAMARAGLVVTGSDLALGAQVEPLRALGVQLFEGHAAQQVEGATLLVRTAAVTEENPEVAAALDHGVPVLKRAQALGQWVERGRVVAIAGTHGKTTTTTLVTEVLVRAGLDPSAFVGGAVRAWGGNYRAGADRVFVVEADEYDRSFHQLAPDVAVVTNVEADHLDIYGDLSGVEEAFRIFLAARRDGGTVVACADDVGAGRVVAGLEDVVSYGTRAGAVLRVLDITPKEGGSAFTLVERGHPAGRFQIHVPGHHNVLNATAAAGAARALGVGWEEVREGLARYRGVGRRLEPLGRVGGIDVLDDYAHHPTEVTATLQALRQAFPGRRLVALFQPHLFSRTRDFQIEFGRALAAADRLWVSDVYPARERPLPGVTGALIAEQARTQGASDVHYHADIATLAAAVAPTLEEGDVCVTLGAGSIEHVGPRLIRSLEEDT
ncbi:MAG: UDP-N-acetylmuramate--L-alanine ligase [Gemmatimonadota bacterium]